MPTIVKGSDYMQAVTYTGNGGTNAITGLSFQPDFVWIKGRSGATDHALYDAVRGATKDLVSNSTAAETTQSTGLVSFDSNGFTLGALSKVNTNGATYVAWCWKAGSSTVTNTNGSISSQVRANPTAGVSVVTYTGNGSAGQSVGHGLGIAPKLWIIKNRSAGTGANWITYTTVIDGTLDYLFLDLTNAAANAGESLPTSSVFYIPNTVTGNTNGNNYVAYAFTDIAGFSKIGSYTGNGSADGPMVYLGFQPKYWLVKRTDGVDDWFVFDSSREPFNSLDLRLCPNGAFAEASTTTGFDFLANGVKVRSSNAAFNASGGKYIYMAFASNPFQNSNAF